jgi:hypothetical protein
LVNILLHGEGPEGTYTDFSYTIRSSSTV